MKKKTILGVILIFISMAGPFEISYVENQKTNDVLDVIMLVLFITGMVAGFVLLNSSSPSQEEGHNHS